MRQVGHRSLIPNHGSMQLTWNAWPQETHCASSPISKFSLQTEHAFWSTISGSFASNFLFSKVSIISLEVVTCCLLLSLLTVILEQLECLNVKLSSIRMIKVPIYVNRQISKRNLKERLRSACYRRRNCLSAHGQALEKAVEKFQAVVR